MIVWLSTVGWAAEFAPGPAVFPLPAEIAAPQLAARQPESAAPSRGAWLGAAGMSAVVSVGSFLAAAHWETAFLAESDRVEAEPLHAKTNAASGVGVATAVATGAFVTVAIVGGGR